MSLYVEDWQFRAACRGRSDLFFFVAPSNTGPDASRICRVKEYEAKEICRDCEVRVECLDFALEHDEREGIWGGLSYRERKSLSDLLTRKEFAQHE